MAIYDASHIGTTANRVDFNDFLQTPIFRVVSRTPQRRDIRELDIPIPFENGISDFETLTGRYAYTIDGVMYPGGESEYDSGIAQLRKLSSLEVSQDDNLSDGGYVPYQWAEFGRSRLVFVKILYVQIIEDTRKGLVQPFRLICKIKDPTIFGSDIKLASTVGSDPTTASGSAVHPFTFPIVYGASTYSVTSTANNAGDLPTYPIGITVVGPVNSPIITNVTTGESLRVNVNLNASSNVLRIAYGKDFVTCELDGNSVLNEASGPFFKLRPGPNEISLSGTSIGSGSYVEVAYRDAWPLS